MSNVVNLNSFRRSQMEPDTDTDIKEELKELSSKIDDLGSIKDTVSNSIDKLDNQLSKLGSRFDIFSKSIKQEDVSIEKIESIISQKLDKRDIPSEDPVIEKLEDIHEAISTSTKDKVLPAEKAKEKAKEKAEELKSKQTEQANSKSSKHLENLNKNIKTGFRRTLVFSDKISNFLFKYTLTAAAGMAKIAAGILGLIVAVDLIQLQMRHWFNKISNLFDMGELTGPLNTVMESIQGLKESFSNGVSGVISRIGSGIGERLDRLRGSIMLGLKNLTASFIDALPFPGTSEKAEKIRTEAIEQYAGITGAKLDESDIELLAKKRLQESENVIKTKESLNQELTLEESHLKSLSEKEKMEVFKERESIIQRAKQLENRFETEHLSSKERSELLKEAKELESIMNNSERMEYMTDTYAKVIETVRMSEAKFEKLVLPEPSSEKEESQMINQTSTTTTNTNNVQNTLVNTNNVMNNRTIMQTPVQTSTPAPGMNRMIP